jgi:hypothetical protein
MRNLYKNPRRLLEILLVILLALAYALLTFHHAHRLNKQLFEYGNENGSKYKVRTSDMWFDGDLPKIKYMMLDRTFVGHAISSEHPFLPIFVFLPTWMLQKLFSLSSWNAIRCFSSIVAFLYIFLQYSVLRIITGHWLDAIIFTSLAAFSASAIFWMPVPESFLIGSLSILLVIFLAIFLRLRNHPIITNVLINLISLSVTITNWAIGMLATILYLNWKRLIMVIIISFGIASILWTAEKKVFPEAQFFFTGSSRMKEFIFYPSLPRIIEVSRTTFFHSMVMPEIMIQNKMEKTNYLSIQQSPLIYRTKFGFSALILWVVLLLGGLIGIFSYSIKEKKNAIFLVGSLVFMLGMHLFFGEETFLYSMHFLPFLVLFASLSSHTRYRKCFLGVALVLIIFVVINNFGQFNNAAEIVDQLAEYAHRINFE